MKNVPIYISTCDKTIHVLQPAILLLEKYWNFEKTVNILGYSDKGLNLPLDKTYGFISMKPKQETIEDWSKDIASVLERETSEFVIFLLDDMLQTGYFDTFLFDILLEKCKTNEKIVRCCLGKDLQQMSHIELGKFNGVTFVEKSVNAPYRHTTQPSLWRRDHLLTVLRSSTNPWDFEVNHNGLANWKRIIGTKGKFISNSLIETALSNNHPGKFNILGMPMEDVLLLLEKGFVKPEQLQFGMKPGLVPQFTEYGENFTLDVLKEQRYQSPQLKENLFTYYSKLYGHIYSK